MASRASAATSLQKAADEEKSAQIGSWTYNAADRTINWSDGLWRLFGRAPGSADLTDETLLSWVRADHRAYHEAQMEKLLTLGPGETVRDFVYPILTPAGEERWIQVYPEARHDDQGRLVELSGIMVDISREKTGEMERARLFDLSHDLLALAGTDGFFKQINDAWRTTLGWEPEDLLAKSFLSFVHPDDIEPTLERIENQKRGESVIQFENRYLCKDGSYRWLEWTSSPESDGTIFAVARDKTEQKRVQLERDRFFDISIDLLVIAGVDGRFKKVNDRWTEILGWEPEELISRPFFDFIHPDDIEPTVSEVERQKHGERVIKFENRYRCKDGGYRWLEWSTQPEPDGTIYAVARDITDRREAERELVEARQEAEDASQAKSKFLAAMSHDLRTPLNAILGFSDMMRQEAFGEIGNPRYREYIEDIHNSGTLLVSLINDILDLSKIEAGKYDLAEEEVDLAEIITVSLHQLESMAKRAGISVAWEIPDGLPRMIGDERALIQVLNNLISNAIKFTTSPGSVTVSASLGNLQGIVLRVSDTGIGMTEADIAKALTPFEQADGTHSRRHEGTGLGIHLCVNLMKLFGGRLEIESEKDKGTTVSLFFPPYRTQKTL
ncbi:MAG: PAS domain S-box protein [Magnetovibrionaceae bacterium]